jgi:hypothetical protein
MPETGASEGPARATSTSAATQHDAINTVRLVDLEVIKRYSLAVRRDAVPAVELLAALDASRDTVLAAIGTLAATDAKAKKKR